MKASRTGEDSPRFALFGRSQESLLRVLLPRGAAGNREECEVMIDQSRAIDNGRFVRLLRVVPRALLRGVEEKLRRLGGL